MIAAWRYDLFISYAHADRAWVNGYLLDALEAAGVRCHSESTFDLGVPRLLEFERALQQSQRILLVLSTAYLGNDSNQFIDLLAQSYGLQTATWPVIPLILHQIALPPRLAMLTTLDAIDPADWPAVIRRLCAALHRPMPGPTPRPPCPYPGMIAFRSSDARFFQGREAEIDRMLQHLRHQRLLLVIGPSGSGKSSLVNAGLLPSLTESSYYPKDFWLIREMRPGDRPTRELAQVLRYDRTQSKRTIASLLSAHPPTRRLLLIIDQFEELFTQAQREEQNRFINALNALRRSKDCALLIALRADFYDDLMNSNLWPIDPSERLEIAPLRGEALRRAIQQPAEDVGVHLEAALLERLLDDAADEPGVLPLIQETMVLLWGKMERRLLTLSAYEELGRGGRCGLAVAMATKADSTLNVLSPEQRAIARRIFLRLVQFGEGRADTRRQQPVDALRAVADNPILFEQTLRHLADHRLLTLSRHEDDTDRRVDIAHEMLIIGWPASQEWVRLRREAELTRRRLEAKAEEWVRLGQGSGGLLDEVELLEADRWLKSAEASDMGYSEALIALVQTSQAHLEAEQAQKRRRIQIIIASLTGGLMIVLLLAIWGAFSAERAAQEADNAHAAQAAAETAQAIAEYERNRARSGELAAQGQAALSKNPQQSLLLAIEALGVTMRTGTPNIAAAEDDLRQALASVGGLGLSGHAGAINALAVSSDSHWLATGSADGKVRLWDLTAQNPAANPRTQLGYEGQITAMAISAGNRWLVVGSQEQAISRPSINVHLWDLAAAKPTPILLPGSEYDVVAISPDNRWLVTHDYDGRTQLWDLTAFEPGAAPVILSGDTGPASAITISPDDDWLVIGGLDGSISAWGLSTTELPDAPTVLATSGERRITIALISPDGRWLLVGNKEDNTARLWDLKQNASTLPSQPKILQTSIVDAAFSPNSLWLAIASSGGATRVWNLESGFPSPTPIELLGYEGYASAVAISPNNRWMVVGSKDSAIRLWELNADLKPSPPNAILHGHEQQILDLSVSPDGHWLITGSADSTARLWDLTAAPDMWLFTASQDNAVRLWNMNAATAHTSEPIVLGDQRNPVTMVAMAPDGHWLLTEDAASSGERTVQLWDLTASPPASKPIAISDSAQQTTIRAVSPDGRWVITREADRVDSVDLWDVTTFSPDTQPIVLHELRSVSASAPSARTERYWLIALDSSGDAQILAPTEIKQLAQPHVLRGYDVVFRSVFSSDSRWLVTASQFGPAQLWNLLDPAADPRPLSGHEGIITAAAVSTNQRWLVVASQDRFADPSQVTIRAWDLDSESTTVKPRIVRLPETTVSTLSFSPDSRWLAALGDQFKTVHLWNLTTDTMDALPLNLSDPANVSAMMFSADSRWLATGRWAALPGAPSARDLDAIRLWDLTTIGPDAKPLTLRHSDAIYAVAIGFDSRWLAAGGADGKIHLWDLNAHDPSATSISFQGHEGSINIVAISPDNHWLITVGKDPLSFGSNPEERMNRLRSLPLEELIRLACVTAGRNLSQTEWQHFFPQQAHHKTCQNLPP